MERWVRTLAAASVALLSLTGIDGGTTSPAPTASPAEHAFTDAMGAQVSRIAQDEVRNGRTPGLAIGIVEDGRVVYARAFGSANAARRVRFEPDTESSIGTLTEQFTAAAVLLLVQDGKLKLADRVTKYLPELSVARNVTIAQLLLQTSGLPSIDNLADIPNDHTRPVKISDLFAAVNKLQPSALPGRAYADNWLNYIVAGTIVEHVSGISLSDYLEQHIFLPLVMGHSFLAGDTGVSPSHAVGYTRTPTGFDAVKAWDPTRLAGAAGMTSTVYDLAKWDIEMPILLRTDTIATMFTPSGVGGPPNYGMGWVIDRRNGQQFVWYAGDIPGYRSVNDVLPNEHIAVIVLSNADSLELSNVTNPQEIGTRVLDILDPPLATQLDNVIITRAQEWLDRLATKEIDRTQLTLKFSSYLTDDLVAREDFAALGKLETIVPLSSTTGSNGDTTYEFLVRYPHAQYHYLFVLTPDGKIDGLSFSS
jgi:D-alanyl-D-alanine carboxypeptidase